MIEQTRRKILLTGAAAAVLQTSTEAKENNKELDVSMLMAPKNPTNEEFKYLVDKAYKIVRTYKDRQVNQGGVAKIETWNSANENASDQGELSISAEIIFNRKILVRLFYKFYPKNEGLEFYSMYFSKAIEIDGKIVQENDDNYFVIYFDPHNLGGIIGYGRNELTLLGNGEKLDFPPDIDVPVADEDLVFVRRLASGVLQTIVSDN